MKIKQHEDNLNLLSTEKSHLEVNIRNSKSSCFTKIGNLEDPHVTIEEVNKQILQLEKSAAGIVCQLWTCHGAQASLLPLTKDVVGIVAMLGKAEDESLSRIGDYAGNCL